MVYSYTVNEVAIAAAYAMLDKADPLSVAAHVVAGYHAENPLTEDRSRGALRSHLHAPLHERLYRQRTSVYRPPTTIT